MTSSLIDAVRAGDLAAARELATPDAVNLADAEGVTPLMAAAGSGRRELAALLLDRGARVDDADARGYTALFHACYNADEDRGYPELVALLLEAGADKEASIGFGVRPLMYAAGNGEAGVVQALLDGGADPLARNEVGRTALTMVKDRDYVDVINILHEAESRVDSGGRASRHAPERQVVTFRKPPPRR